MEKKMIDKSPKIKKQGLKSITRFTSGEFGPDDGSYKPKKSKNIKRKMIKKENLSEEYIKDNDNL